MYLGGSVHAYLYFSVLATQNLLYIYPKWLCIYKQIVHTIHKCIFIFTYKYMLLKILENDMHSFQMLE